VNDARIEARQHGGDSKTQARDDACTSTTSGNTANQRIQAFEHLKARQTPHNRNMAEIRNHVDDVPVQTHLVEAGQG
jgi:hypothetical protein